MLAAPRRVRPLAIAGAALTLLAALLSGCSKDEPAQTLPDGATLINESAAAMREVQSAHVRIEIEGKVSTLPLKRAEGDLLRNGDAVVVRDDADLRHAVEPKQRLVQVGLLEDRILVRRRFL